MNRPARPSPRNARRGFAIPIVIFLTMIAAIMMTVMISRSATQAAVIRQHKAMYETHHMGRGATELIDRYINLGLGGNVSNLRDHLGANGLVMTAQLPVPLTTEGQQRQFIRVYFRDSQSSLLTSKDALALRQQEVIERAMVTLESQYGRAGARKFYRKSGPLPISVMNADSSLLRAVIDAITQGNGTDAVVSALLDARGDDEVTQAELTEAIAAAELEPTQRLLMTEFLAAEPRLYKVTAEVVESATGKVLARYSGLSTISTGVDETMGQNSSKSFLRDWRREDIVESEEAGDSTPAPR